MDSGKMGISGSNCKVLILTRSLFVARAGFKRRGSVSGTTCKILYLLSTIFCNMRNFLKWLTLIVISVENLLRFNVTIMEMYTAIQENIMQKYGVKHMWNRPKGFGHHTWIPTRKRWSLRPSLANGYFVIRTWSFWFTATSVRCWKKGKATLNHLK